MRKLCFTALLLALLSCEEARQSKPISPVPFSDVRIEDSFWSPRLQAHKEVTLAVCIDQIENQTGRIRNYENAAKGRGEHSGIFFDDSDVYKALEGMAYSLQNHPDVSTDGCISESEYNHRIYCTTTRDFETFSPTRLYFNPSFNVIDACVMRVPQSGELLMALKNENLNPPEKNIRLTRSRSMADGFPTEVSAPISGEEWAEGPTLIPIGDDILVYVDQFRKHRYGAALSHDGGYTWEDATDRISVPAEMSHGTAIVVPERYVKALAGHNFETE